MLGFSRQLANAKPAPGLGSTTMKFLSSSPNESSAPVGTTVKTGKPNASFHFVTPRSMAPRTSTPARRGSFCRRSTLWVMRQGIGCIPGLMFHFTALRRTRASLGTYCGLALSK